MPEGQENLFPAIIVVSLIFLVICIGLIMFVNLFNDRRKKHVIEKQMMQQQFDSEILKVHIEVQEQTMQTLAADLHDNIGQLLSLTNLTLGSIDLKDSEKSAHKIDTSVNLINTSIKELRDLAKLFNGEQLVEISLLHAIQQEISWLERSDRYQINAHIDLPIQGIKSPNKDLIILRVLQEIFNNIIKHAEASLISIKAHLSKSIFYLQVTDNGVGFDYEKMNQLKGGLGLNSLYKRVQLADGQINIRSTTNGTDITIEIPYP